MKSSAVTLKEFKAFFKAFYPSLCLFANSYLHDKEASKDVVQDVFIKIWEKSIQFDSGAKAKSFLYTTVKNRCIDILRSSRIRLTDQEVDVNLLERKDSDSYFYGEVIATETTTLLSSAIAKLPPQCAKVIVLVLKGYSNKEIANELSVSLNTVKTQRKIAYQKLREILDREY